MASWLVSVGNEKIDIIFFKNPCKEVLNEFTGLGFWVDDRSGQIAGK